jgi:hypothetical protein
MMVGEENIIWSYTSMLYICSVSLLFLVVNEKFYILVGHACLHKALRSTSTQLIKITTNLLH